jgi:DedD protein
MAFFKLRKAAGEQTAPAPAPESVDALRRRARYRLAGAALLVLAGVIGFPLLFDNQPRPIAVDIPIDIPDKTKVRPLVADTPATATAQGEVTATPAVAPVAAAPAVAASLPVATGSMVSAVAAGASKEAKPQPKEPQKEEVIISSAKPASSVTPAKTPDKAVAKADEKPAVISDAKPADKKADKPADGVGRFVVQFGAFSDSAHAHEARLKVEKTGLKTYAQIAETPDGKRFRVRVGPFDKRGDAEKAADKIKKIGLPAAILGL